MKHLMIDFSCSFNLGIHLKVPELVPFRLTPNLIGLGYPFEIESVFKSHMVKIAQVFSNKKFKIVDYIEIYLDEPIIDWKKLDLSQSINNNQFINTRVSICEKKLQ